METITISEVVTGKTEKGVPFWKVDTNQGRMSCWDEKIASTLINNTGRSVEVDIKTSPCGKFKNIRKLGTNVENFEVETVKMSGPKEITPTQDKSTQDKFSAARKEKNTSMFVSYAKDIFCVMRANNGTTSDDDLMEHSIELVKQAIKAFE